MKTRISGNSGIYVSPIAIDTGEVSEKSTKQTIEALPYAMGATAAIGTKSDPDFLFRTFKGSDIVYVMETLGA